MLHDRETGSLWPQPWGECFKGPAEVKKLTEYPSIHTTYSEFKKLYPHGKLLRKPEKGEPGSPYAKYFDDPEKLGMFGRLDNYERLRGKDKVFGIRRGVKQVAVSLDYLKANGKAMITGLGDPVVVTYDPTGETVSAFVFEGDQRALVKGLQAATGRLIAPGGGTVWCSRTGKVMEGKGRDLTIIPTMTAYWFAWLSFFQDTKLIN